MFDPKKFQNIYEDMRNRTTVLTDFEVGSVTRTIYESFAYEIALLYEKMYRVYLSAYADTAEGQQLDNVVSVLGIKRGLPDFAEGIVTFNRDVGNQDIEILVGTLIATEDKPNSPKKVYQTFESKTLPKDNTSVDVKVKAVNRGEDQTTAAETIVVMPRPIPGIKSIINKTEIKFLGKRRETDEELRERGKNALISSGKATSVSIENALLSLSSVKDVKVKENFHFALGKVTFKRTSPKGDITIPKVTKLSVSVAGAKKTFFTTEEADLIDGESYTEVPVQSTVIGKNGEVLETTSVTWTIDSSGLETLSVSNDKPIQLGTFGIIEVVVDCIDFTDPDVKARIQKEADQVRAAGIFVLLKPVAPVKIDGIFKIVVNPGLNLSDEERTEFEGTVRSAISNFIDSLKMGQALSFSKVVKDILTLEGIEDLEDFQITAIKNKNGTQKEIRYHLLDKRIEIDEVERFLPQNICVASEIKSLLVNIQFKANNLNDAKLAEILTALNDYFNSLKISDKVMKNKIESQIGNSLVAGTLKLIPISWCTHTLLKEGTDGLFIDTTFVEQPVLGDVFAYHSYLDIIGALKLTLPTTMTDNDKKNTYINVKKEIKSYLENLKSEQDLLFTDVKSVASAIDRVLAVTLNIDDFRVELNGTEKTTERIDKKKIEVLKFEKTRLKYFCITGEIEKVRIIVNNVSLQVLAPPILTVELQNELKSSVKNVINNFLADAVPGNDLIYKNLKSAIEGLVSGVRYVVTELSLTANSLCDERTQHTNIATGQNIHVRSVEIPVFVPINDEDVKLTLI